MAFDGIFLSLIKKELTPLVGSRIEKISQPSMEELVISFRGKDLKKRLIFSINPLVPRLHLTSSTAENPLSPPMFCMLLRKRLSSAKLLSIEQVGLDRILVFSFEARNDFGDLVTLRLISETMARRSNLILTEENGKIIDCLKRVPFSLSSVRALLPGVFYELPPREEKLSLFSADFDQAIEKIKATKKPLLHQGLLSVFEGFSPLISKELAFRAFKDKDAPLSSLDGNEEAFKSCLEEFLKETKTAKSGYILFRKAFDEEFSKEALGSIPTEFSFVPISFYGDEFFNKELQGFSPVLDEFYEKKALAERIKLKGGDLKKLLNSALDRAKRKLLARETEQKNADKKDQLKIMGDILSANLFLVKKGMREITLQNFYSDSLEEITIPLDERKSPSQNVDAFYKEYKRLKNASEKLEELIFLAKEEILYLESCLDILKRCESEKDLMELREELFTEGYIKKSSLIESEKKLSGRSKNKSAKASISIKPSPKEFVSSDGFTILCGKNNLENDYLTFKKARAKDLWLHVKDIPGSHVVVVSMGKEIPEGTILEAANIAVQNSSAKGKGTKVPVDYTLIKNVKKPKGAKAGRVIYTSFKTILTEPIKGE